MTDGGGGAVTREFRPRGRCATYVSYFFGGGENVVVGFFSEEVDQEVVTRGLGAVIECGFFRGDGESVERRLFGLGGSILRGSCIGAASGWNVNGSCLLSVGNLQDPFCNRSQRVPHALFAFDERLLDGWKRGELSCYLAAFAFVQLRQ